jgi:predicted PurR-regulated permease PerM
MTDPDFQRPGSAGTGEATFALNPERDLTEPELAVLREQSRQRIELERRELNERARRRLIGYCVIAVVVVAALLPILVILGFESGLMIGVFKLTVTLLS